MSVFNKTFLIGLASGVALAMVVLTVWATYMDRKLTYLSLPPLLRPLPRHQIMYMPESSARLPRPWLPETSRQLHDVWKLRPLSGVPIRFAEFKGRVVFLNFWSTTCAPCIAEMPGIKKLQDSLKDNRLAFLAVTYEDEKTVRDFLNKVPLRVPIYLADDDSPGNFRVVGVPTTYILDRNGSVVFRDVGPFNWDDDGARAFIRNLAE